MNSNRSRQNNLIMWAFIGLALLGHVVTAYDTAKRLSVTHDEYWHLPVGLLTWKTARFDFDPINPPLVRLWASLPLLSAQPGELREPGDRTGFGDAFLAANKDDFQRLFLAGRMMIVLLSVATAIVLAFWSRELFGRKAACLAVLLWVTSPTVLGHASLVTTDVGAAFFFVATLYALHKFAQSGSWRTAIAFGCLLGLSQLAKFTCLLLLPLSVCLWWVVRFRNRGEQPPSFRLVVWQWLAALFIGGVVLNAGYLFRGSFSNLGSYQFQSQAMNNIAANLSGFQWCPVPLPRDYLEGVDQQNAIMAGSHPVFLDGQWYTEGVNSYYLMAMLYKLSHPLQILLLLAVVFAVKPANKPRMGRELTFLLCPVVVLLVISSAVSMQLGIRYILPVFPFLVLLAGQTARWFQPKRYPLRSVFLGLLAALAPFSLRHHPEHIAYFNELAGGPVLGREHLLDSNLDWGQDLEALKEFMTQNNIDEIALAYFGTLPPDQFGIRYHLPKTPLTPGWYAVSVNIVQGRPYAIRQPDGNFYRATVYEYGYFRRLKPVATIGASIDVFYIPETRLRL